MITRKEWKEKPAGATAIKIKTFDGNTGNLINITYFNENETDEIKDERQVADGYYTETCKVTHK